MKMRILLSSSVLCLVSFAGFINGVGADEPVKLAVNADGPAGMPPPPGGGMMFHRSFGPHFGPGPGGPGPMMCGMPPFPPDLNLSDDQLEAMHKKRNEHLAKAEPLHAELRIAESAYFDALTQPSVDKDQVRQLQSKVSNLRSQLDSLMTEHMLSMSDVLTLEQRKKMRKMAIRGPMPLPFPPGGHEGHGGPPPRD